MKSWIAGGVLRRAGCGGASRAERYLHNTGTVCRPCCIGRRSDCTRQRTDTIRYTIRPGARIELRAAASAHCQSASGNIRLNNVSGTLRAAAGPGSIVAEIVRGRPLADSILSTQAGDITVFVPSDKGVSIEVESAGTAR